MKTLTDAEFNAALDRLSQLTEQHVRSQAELIAQLRRECESAHEEIMRLRKVVKDPDIIVRDITICNLPYQSPPFVHGWIMTRDGPKDVWLRDDGAWTTDETDERNSLKTNGV